MRYIGNSEWADVIEDYQWPPDMIGTGPSDLGAVEQSISELDRTPLGEPRTAFDVRCVYDSRPVNGYDFNLSATSTDTSATNWSVTFNVPNGYRMVPREWEVVYDTPPPTGPLASGTMSIQQNGANLPNNSGIIIGQGTSRPVKTFFVCEENTTFGATGHNTNITSGALVVNVNVYGNLLAVTDVALPFEVTNRKFGT